MSAVTSRVATFPGYSQTYFSGNAFHEPMKRYLYREPPFDHITANSLPSLDQTEQKRFQTLLNQPKSETDNNYREFDDVNFRQYISRSGSRAPSPKLAFVVYSDPKDSSVYSDPKYSSVYSDPKDSSTISTEHKPYCNQRARPMLSCNTYHEDCKMGMNEIQKILSSSKRFEAFGEENQYLSTNDSRSLIICDYNPLNIHDHQNVFASQQMHIQNRTSNFDISQSCFESVSSAECSQHATKDERNSASQALKTSSGGTHFDMFTIHDNLGNLNIPTGITTSNHQHLSSEPTCCAPKYSVHKFKRRRRHIPHALRTCEFVKKRNDRERRRISNVNDAFEYLRQHIPATRCNAKSPKISILRKAISYISELSAQLRGTSDLSSWTC